MQLLKLKIVGVLLSLTYFRQFAYIYSDALRPHEYVARIVGILE